MKTIAICDERHRLIVRDAIPGQSYLVNGLTVTPLDDVVVPAQKARRVKVKLVRRKGLSYFETEVPVPPEAIGDAVRAERDAR